MARIRLTGGAYTARSIIASAQRQVNLFAEAGVPGAITDVGGGNSLVAALRPSADPPAILYPTPGLRPLGTTFAPTGGFANASGFLAADFTSDFESIPEVTFTAQFAIADFSNDFANGSARIASLGNARGLYYSSTGVLFYVAGRILYTVDAVWNLTQIGTIAAGTNPVSMADNRLALLLVDGSDVGYQVDLQTMAFSVIDETTNGPPPNTTNPASSPVYEFTGGDRVTEVDGILIYNKPATPVFLAAYPVSPVGLGVDSPPTLPVFDSTWFGSKSGYPDNIVTVAVNQRSIWLIGERTTEIWYNAGSDAGFPFALMPGPFVAHGCAAKYSIVRVQESLLWLSQDQSGGNIMVRTKGYEVVRVSTHAIEAEWATYATTSDASSAAFQQAGHDFVQLTFPTADKTWRLDVTTGEWHEAVWTDTSGKEHRHRAGAIAYAYGTNVAADWETGQLYALDAATFDDNGQPIVHRRGFPHMVYEGNRVFYQNLILDMAPGNSVGTSSQTVPDTSPLVSLRWSDDRGRTFGNPIFASMGATGEYLTSIQFTRLGIARDRVFEVSWSAAVNTALQGAFVVLRRAET